TTCASWPSRAGRTDEPALERVMECVVLHGGHVHNGASEWLWPILLGTGIGPALIAPCLARRRPPPPHPPPPNSPQAPSLHLSPSSISGPCACYLRHAPAGRPAMAETNCQRPAARRR